MVCSSLEWTTILHHGHVNTPALCHGVVQKGLCHLDTLQDTALIATLLAAQSEQLSRI